MRKIYLTRACATWLRIARFPKHGLTLPMRFKIESQEVAQDIPEP